MIDGDSARHSAVTPLASLDPASQYKYDVAAMNTERLIAHAPEPNHTWWAHLLAALLLALFVLLLYFPLLFTNRVLASGDILLYFYPYRDYAAAALRQGQIPLWNPYIFLGVPFLANPQAAVLYPLHWPFIWLPVTQQVYWSAALHTWLLGFGGYLLTRRWGFGVGAGLVCALTLAGSGFYGGLIGHLNQMNGASWLPWAFWLLDCGFWIYRRTSDANPQSKSQNLKSKIVGFAILVALMFLAGHAQTAYINLFAVGTWVIWPLLIPLFRLWPRQQGARLRISFANLQSLNLSISRPLIIYFAGTILGLFLSAAQMLPTLELSALGLRSGGLSYAEATSFSLKPLHLPWTLLPSYGLFELGAVFATPAYTEYVAYVGLIGLVLAAMGAWKGHGTARTFGLLFAGLGFLLALGRWNPVYWALYTLVPGFDLFRNPARWMMLYTLGMAVLAGVGGDWLWKELKRLEIGNWRLGVQHPISNYQSPIFGSSPLAPAVLIALLSLDLLLAARALPHTQTTAPQAMTDVRTAVAHLLTDPTRTEPGPAAMGRFLGMSTTTYDPGDLPDWRRIFLESEPPQLDQRAFEQLIIALKAQELSAPNLSLLWRLPAVDGFDGGVLPLRRYNDLLTLFVPPEELVPDGRLREQLRTMPATALLNLLHVQYVITDKVRDLWFEDVFYDRQIGATLHAGGVNAVEIDVHVPFEATHLDLIAFIEGDVSARNNLQAQNLDVAEVHVHSKAGLTSFTLTAGGQSRAQLADGMLDSPLAASSGATVAYRDVEGGRQEYRVRLALPQPAMPITITVQPLDTPFDVIVQAATLVDAQTGMFTPLLPSDRGRFRLAHSGDVKIYENLDAPQRAYLAYTVTGVDDSQAALALLRSSDFVPGQTAVVEGLASFRTSPHDGDQVEIVSYIAERIELRTRTGDQTLLVLSDTAYPGWIATVDGVETSIYTTNYLFRGVPLSAGEHTVIFRYQPASWRRGLWVSGLGILLSVALVAVGIRRHRP